MRISERGSTTKYHPGGCGGDLFSTPPNPEIQTGRKEGDREQAEALSKSGLDLDSILYLVEIALNHSKSSDPNERVLTTIHTADIARHPSLVIESDRVLRIINTHPNSDFVTILTDHPNFNPNSDKILEIVEDQHDSGFAFKVAIHPNLNTKSKRVLEIINKYPDSKFAKTIKEMT